MPDAAEVLAQLRGMRDEENLAGMGRFGIETSHALGISVTDLRKIARALGRDHDLAAGLWAGEIHEARILASMVDEPAKVTRTQMERWVKAFDSWDLCDQVCMNLFDRTPYAWDKAEEWAGRRAEFVKRAAFSLMASLAAHDKSAPDDRFLPFLAAIEHEAWDDRNFVKKGVNWALRGIGKRNRSLHALAVATAERIGEQDTPSAHWVARDALTELRSEKVLARLS
jgi:3-methyladenine DNA glycosylase AlkD